MTKIYEHITFEERKVINNLLSTTRESAKTIGELIHKDPTSISKELKRNRYESRKAHANTKDPICKKTLRYPYVCNGCDLRRKITCHYKQYLYDPLRAQKQSDYHLRVTRAGINLTKEEFEILDKKIKDGVLGGNSIYHIVNDEKDIGVSVSTVYRYINSNLLSTSISELPNSNPKIKKRKAKKEYEYLENRKIDRSNRTYLDYLSFLKRNPNEFIFEMDFLGSIKTDSKCILTLVIPNIHFVVLFLIEKKNSNKIVNLFNELERFLGLKNFKKLFPCILTDRDPSFSDYIGIEYSSYTGEERTKLFYCDAFKSNQKGSVENMNKQLRRYFPKKSSVDDLDDNFIKTVMHKLNDNRLSSLSGFSANEAFIDVYDKELLDKLYSFKY